VANLGTGVAVEGVRIMIANKDQEGGEINVRGECDRIKQNVAEKHVGNTTKT